MCLHMFTLVNGIGRIVYTRFNGNSRTKFKIFMGIPFRWYHLNQERTTSRDNVRRRYKKDRLFWKTKFGCNNNYLRKMVETRFVRNDDSETLEWTVEPPGMSLKLPLKEKEKEGWSESPDQELRTLDFQEPPPSGSRPRTSESLPYGQTVTGIPTPWPVLRKAKNLKVTWSNV